MDEDWTFGKDFDILIIGSLKRNLKFLAALSSFAQILSPKWVYDSEKQKKFLGFGKVSEDNGFIDYKLLDEMYRPDDSSI